MSTDQVKDSPTWTEGDITIMTSDGVRFKVEAHALSWAR